MRGGSNGSDTEGGGGEISTVITSFTGTHFSPIKSGPVKSQTASATNSTSSRSPSSAKASLSQKQRSAFEASINWQHLVVSPDLASGSASKGVHASLNAFVLETQDFGISKGPIGLGETRPDVHGTPSPRSQAGNSSASKNSAGAFLSQHSPKP